MSKADPGHPIRSQEEEIVVALDDFGLLLEYVPLVAVDSANKNKLLPLQISSGLFSKASTFTIRSDLLDCRIAICSPLVLELFVDNFDYDNIAHFIRGVLDDELNEYRIFTHILDNEYAARVSNHKTYEAISMDVLHRWTFPFVPDVILYNNSSYKYKRNNIYIDDEFPLIIFLQGKGCRLHNCYIYDNVHLGEHCTIEKGAILSHNVLLGAHVLVQEKAVLADTVTLPDNHVVAPYQRYYYDYETGHILVIIW
ncbi:hypothetical protein Zmor_003989 [Zophobas morio]|uniref:Translation initiation factor eIF-2B subunit epsilon n=1 Tax=Zophobas morio TaxID=2755281 RepID=A0AA38HK12_9CUCU|nr:hypothetical protein Zmor_003989 [Zophobas morio]